ncbi:hypothetical protein L0664_10985 [Octadecabacter sp. G9-8]|uniref:Flagellin C-terminal domain-containing protein n=1 Tax=Octadecabacter dasysiphoniae TaxID=2909341 RepID=A0ABS9CYX8_9RHOB|nr:flagellin [Octadecabacter dasysiphoniae]MCF2871589.1 hypothetical protein [Octadecabacter dasysiphoniae]
MPISTIGDIQQHFLSSRNTSSMKSELNTLVQELTTGQASDLTSHLGVSQSELSSLDRQLQMLARFNQSNTETGQLLSTMQIALDNIEQHRADAGGTLLIISDSSTLSQISDAGRVALSGFEATVQSLNMRSAGRSMFGGADLDSNPLAPPGDMIDALKTTVAGLTDVGDITTAIDTWFDVAGGGFDTIGYQGDAAGFVQRPIDASQNVEIQIRADDDTLKDTLKALALGALAGDTDLALSTQSRQTLQQQAAEDLFSVAAPLASVQGRLGYAEGQVEEASVRNSAQEASFGIARNTLVSADPFETATRLEAVQLQLETHYTLIARLSRLSLTEYLR